MEAIEWLDEEGLMFQAMVRRLLAENLEPNIEAFESDGVIPRSLWEKMAQQGILCPSISEKYGGTGTDFTFNMAVSYECGYANGGTALGITVHSDIIAYYINNHGTEAQKQHYLPKMCTAELIGGLALTEPGAEQPE